jgi:hypothetical protein
MTKTYCNYILAYRGKGVCFGGETPKTHPPATYRLSSYNIFTIEHTEITEFQYQLKNFSVGFVLSVVDFLFYECSMISRWARVMKSATVMASNFSPERRRGATFPASTS